MSWRKEKKEHPWATNSQAKRIAKDHHKPKPKMNKTNQSSPAIQAATKDTKLIGSGMRRITYGKHKLKGR